uniref:ISXO2-like transposase domain-containing protein n=1 Tax=Octopus bimaculoides TaxID=37653 RepID=A0A0L8IEN9_OCTBM
MKYPLELDGEGMNEEIDESAFVRRKINAGRKCLLVAVQDRSTETLLRIIQQHIRPGTIIISDLWKAYKTISNLGYNHLTVNHAVNFVDPDSHASNNHVKAKWNSAKRRNKSEIGTARTCLNNYLVEVMWRY